MTHPTLHPIVYAELHTSQPAAAREFYRRLFGWQMNHHPEFDYTEIVPGEGPGAGLMGLTPHDSGPAWVTYVGVADLDAAAARAVELGAKVRMARTEVPGQGWFVWLDDPHGARFALWQKAQP